MLHAIFITPSARQWLARTRAARVLNRFERACNLINQDEAILTLVTSERGLTPFAVVVASADQVSFAEVADSSQVRVEGDRLRVDPLEISLAAAAVWDPIPGWPGLRRCFAEHPTRLGELSEIALELAVQGSLLDLYRTPGSPADRHSGGAGALLERARAGAASLLGGLRSGRAEPCIQGTKLLAGLGSGLTPSGDDFALGAILAAWAGLFGSGREALMAVIAETAAPLTTSLSGAYLRAAARGECIAYWHTLLAALQGGDKEVIRMAAKSLMSIGHSSGADALAGFLAVELLPAA